MPNHELFHSFFDILVSHDERSEGSGHIQGAELLSGSRIAKESQREHLATEMKHDWGYRRGHGRATGRCARWRTDERRKGVDKV